MRKIASGVSIVLGLALAASLAVSLVVSLAGCGGAAPTTSPAGDPVVLQFQVDGMHCGGCEQSITTAVEGLDGMKVLALSHTNGVLRVESDGRSDPAKVLKVVTPLGYQVSAVPSGADEAAE